MLNEHQIQMLPERIYQRLNAINTDYLISIGEVLKDIGELRPTDIHQLQQMYNYGSRVDQIVKRLAEYSEKNIDDIYDIFDTVAKENYKFAKPFYRARLMDYIPYEENTALQRTVKAMAKQTVDEYVNLTQHTAFAVFDKDGKSIAPYFAANKDKIATSLSDTYTKVVDYAVTQVNLGMESYSKAVKDIIKSMSASGIRTVDYAKDENGKGYSRRLDSAVRQNVLFAAKECNQQIANQVGEEFGANGREVDYHMYPRPSHADMGGRQFALGKARTVNGVFYPSFEEKVAPLLEEFGCLHFSFPIILGVSQPAYSKEELAEFKEADNATFEFEGKKYTMYQGTQLQRQVETAIRNQRDILTMAKAAGDGEEELIARTKIRQLTDKYAELSEVSGLPTQMERTKLAVSTKTVDKSRGSGIMTKKTGATVQKAAVTKTTIQKSTEGSEVQYLGKIDIEIFRSEFGELITDEVVLTDERKQHIIDGHSADFELFDRYAQSILEAPELVLKDEKNENTVFIINHIEDTNLNIVIKLAVHGDEKHPKNSIMTSYRIRDKNVKKLEKKNKILYKRE